MRRPPLLMHLRFENEANEQRFGLWLPLFLLLPLALVVLIFLSPLILIGVLVLWPFGWGEWAVRVLGAAAVVFHASRGLEVNVKNRDRYVYISLV